jgi:hypothetical protein
MKLANRAQLEQSMEENLFRSFNTKESDSQCQEFPAHRCKVSIT